MVEITEQILKIVDERNEVNTLDLALVFKLDHQKIIDELSKIIKCNGLLNVILEKSHKSWELTDKGKNILANGSHGAIVFNSIPNDGICKADLIKVLWS